MDTEVISPEQNVCAAEDSTMSGRAVRRKRGENSETLNNYLGIRRVDVSRVKQKRPHLLKESSANNEDFLNSVIAEIVISPDEAKFKLEEKKLEEEEEKEYSQMTNKMKKQFQDKKNKIQDKKKRFESESYISEIVTFDSDAPQACYKREEYFKLAYYVKTLHRNYKFGCSIAGNGLFPETSYSSVLFLYRVKPTSEIFYIVNNQAWKAMDWCADYEFPVSMCKRLLSPKGPSSRKAKPLSGNVAHEALIYREAERVVNIFKPVYEYNIRAHFREKCSIFGLPLTIKKLDENMEPPMKQRKKKLLHESLKAEVGNAFFKVEKNLSISDFLHLCHHFSTIYSKKPTKLTNMEDETDTDAYEQLFQPIERDTKSKLDQQMVKMLFENPTSQNECISNQFIFIHPHTQDFDMAEKRELHFPGKPPVELGEFTLKSVMEIVEEHLKPHIREHTHLPGPLKNKETEKLFKKVSVSYEKNKHPQGKVKILRCIGGFMQDADSDLLCWRINGKWYEVKQDLIARAHESFIELLNTKTFLLTEKDVDFLKYKWLGKAQLEYFHGLKNSNKKERLDTEGIFNAYFGFVNNGRFIVGDKICFHGVELFDVMEIKRKGKHGHEAYLYHVKKGFNTATREACAQIQNAFRVITNPSRDNFKDLEKFYERVKSNQVNLLNEKVFENLDSRKFVELLQKGKFVYAVYDDSKRDRKIASKYQNKKGVPRSLLQEKSTKLQVTEKNLESLLADNNKKDHVEGLKVDHLKKMLKINSVQVGFKACATKIRELLVNGEYLNENGKATKKFLTALKQDFQLGDLSKKDNNTILNILNNFRSSYLCSTFVPHLEIIRTWIDLKEKFAICEISAELDDTPQNEFHEFYLKNIKSKKRKQPELKTSQFNSVSDVNTSATLANTEISQIPMSPKPGTSSGYYSMDDTQNSFLQP